MNEKPQFEGSPEYQEVLANYRRELVETLQAWTVKVQGMTTAREVDRFEHSFISEFRFLSREFHETALQHVRQRWERKQGVNWHE